MAIETAFSPKEQKSPLLRKIKIEVEVIKRLTRLSAELNIIKQTAYLKLIIDLQEISKMATGWLKYSEKKEPV